MMWRLCRSQFSQGMVPIKGQWLLLRWKVLISPRDFRLLPFTPRANATDRGPIPVIQSWNLRYWHYQKEMQTLHLCLSWWQSPKNWAQLCCAYQSLNKRTEAAGQGTPGCSAGSGSTFVQQPFLPFQAPKSIPPHFLLHANQEKTR